MNTFHTQKGQSVAEVLVAIAVMTLCVAAVGTMVIDAKHSTEGGLSRMEATLLAEEGIEAVRSMRDGGSLLSLGAHGLDSSSGRFEFSGESDTQDQFIRTVLIEDAGTGMKRVTSTVQWDTYGTTDDKVEMVALLRDPL